MMKFFFLMLLFSMTSLFFSMLLMHMNLFLSINIMITNILNFNIPINILMDWISLMFMSTVIFISSMIMMFSMYYIPKYEHKQFLMLLTLFILSMLILIMSNNIFLMLLGWDGLGLSSYILVIYYQNSSSSASGSITLLSNRIGDILILLSIGMILTNKNWNLYMNEEFSLITILLLMTAACSKSAQFPFSAWLPAAMAAPTPISALVHSSTLVTAGVFLMIRIMTNPHSFSLLILMLISSSTAIYASISANWEQDLKKIIALSTLSQIAMMMFSISILAINMAFSHLIIHALFKSTMFLCAGILIHEFSYQDSRHMGMNTQSIPITLSVLGMTSMSLMGIPFMSGFFSKDLIIEKMISSKLECTLSLLMISSIGMTTFYSIRMTILANKLFIKSFPNSSNHFSFFYNIPIMTMSLSIITSGTFMLWMITPEQMMFIPDQIKSFIILIIITSIIMSYSLSFKNMNFLKLGFPSKSLWFNHTLITKLMPLFSFPMLLYSNNDKSYKEIYGPHMFYLMNMNLSKIPELSKYSLMLLMILLTTLPIMFFM